MAEVYLNSNFPVKTKIYYAGEVVNADGTVVAKVYDITEDPAISPAINPEELLIQITATKSDVDPGTYQIVFPFSLTSRNRKFKIEWTYAISSELVKHYSYIDVVTPYVELADAVEDLSIATDSSDPNSRTYHELIMAEKWARGIIENYTGQQFSLYNDLAIVYGDGSDSLRLPFKINEIHEIYQNDILLVDTINNVNNWNYETMISESGFGIRINRAGMIDNTVYTANGMVPPSINDGYAGTFNTNSVYKIQGVFGWKTVPDAVGQACIQLMGHFFDKDRAWKDQYVKKIQSFDWQIEYLSNIHSGTGCGYADKLLAPYVLTNMVVI